MTATCEQHRINLGAYVLGALDPSDRASTEAHLSDCAGCRAELVNLAGLPGLLGRLSLADLRADLDDHPRRNPALNAPAGNAPAGNAAAVNAAAGNAAAGNTSVGLSFDDEPGPDPAFVPFPGARHPGRRLSHRGRPQRRRRAGVVAAAAAVLIGLLVGAVTIWNPGPSARTAVATDGGTHVRAWVQLTGSSTGTVLAIKLIQSSVQSPSPGTVHEPQEHCMLIAIAADGHQDTAASWEAAYGTEANVRGHTAIPLSQLAAVEVVTSDGERLVRVPVA